VVVDGLNLKGVNMEFIRNIQANIIVFYETVKRFFYYGWKLRKNGDWDYNYLYKIIHLKICNIEKAIKNDKLHSWSKRDFRDLKIAKNCLDRLINDRYTVYSNEDRYLERKVHPEFGIVYSIKPDKLKFYKKSLEKEQYLRNQDMDMFCKILKERSTRWWI